MTYKKTKKSQSAIEFVILIFFVITIFTIFFLSVQERMSDKAKKNKNNQVEEIAVTVQDEIMLASKSSEGYYRQFKIPLDINGQEYKINLSEGSVYIRTSDMKYSLALPIPNVTGDINKGENFIQKKDGRLFINFVT